MTTLINSFLLRLQLSEQSAGKTRTPRQIRTTKTTARHGDHEHEENDNHNNNDDGRDDDDDDSKGD